MTFNLTEDLEHQVAERAEQLGVSPDEVVQRAVTWFLDIEPELRAELRDWPRMNWKAWDTVEESLR